MMKHFLCLLGLLTGTFLASAEPAVPSPAALNGDFATALAIPSAPVRQTALLKLLPASSADASLNMTLYCLLRAEFEEKEPDKMVREELARLYKAHPADLTIVSLYADYADMENRQSVLERALPEIVPPQDKRLAGYVRLIESALENIPAQGDPLETAWLEKLFEARLALLDRVTAKQKTPLFVLTALRLDQLRKAIYYCDDLVPEQKQFKDLPADHCRKKLYEETLAQWKKFLFAKDKTSFLKQFSAAIALGLPECDQFAAEAARRFGVMDEEIQKLITESAVKRNRYANFHPCAGSNPFTDTLVALGCKDFETAEKMAKGPQLKRLVALSKAAEKGDQAEVSRILDALPPPRALSVFEFQAILQMVEVTHNIPLYWRIRKMMLAQSKAENIRNDLANSLGFVAVTLNVDLELAAKLLEQVYAEEKTPAYTDSIAMLRLRQGRYDEAAKLIREAFLLRDPGDPASVFLLHAAQIIAVKGDKVLARKLLARAKRCVRPEDFEYDSEIEKKLTEMLK